MNKFKKFLINIIPVKKWRHAIRYWERTVKYECLSPAFNVFFDNDNFKIDKDIITVCGIKFINTNNKLGTIEGLGECFGRKDYEFGGINNYIFIDLGTNIGDSALYAATSKNCQKIYSYEPFPNQRSIAEKNFKLNPELSQKIELYNYGWGNKNEDLEIFSNNDLSLSRGNSVKNQEKNIADSNSQKIIVKIKNSSEELKRILSITPPQQKIVLKMDIEGSEYDCIQDLDNNDLLKYIDIIILEWHYKGNNFFFDILKKNGFIWFHSQCDSKDLGVIKAVNINKNINQKLQ